MEQVKVKRFADTLLVLLNANKIDISYAQPNIKKKLSALNNMKITNDFFNKSTLHATREFPLVFSIFLDSSQGIYFGKKKHRCNNNIYICCQDHLILKPKLYILVYRPTFFQRHLISVVLAHHKFPWYQLLTNKKNSKRSF
jgi:hypothetical protein